MLSKYSLGVGDRFANQGKYQLKAFVKAANQGIRVTPVWNKSHREHSTVGTSPKSVLKEAKKATKALNWNKPYAVDADHITLENVDPFIPYSSFFTIDVANYIGKKGNEEDIEEFIRKTRAAFLDELIIKGLSEPLTLTIPAIREVSNKFFFAIQRAYEIYKYIKRKKDGESFFVEISMDEVEEAQKPVELFLILLMIAHFEIPIDTLAPKFTGRFNKGVDYEGDTGKFAREFEDFLILMKYGAKHMGMNPSQKLSVHTGSDKFSLYPIINQLIKKHKMGLHLKTAGTTWLEEMIGLAEAGDDGLELAKSIYAEALDRYEELTDPYLNVLNIDRSKLPSKEEVQKWSGTLFADSLRNNPDSPHYNPNFRQLIHTGYKIAAQRDEEFTGMLKKYEKVIGKNVFENIYYRHMKPLFLD